MRSIMRLGFYFHWLATLIVLCLLSPGLSFAQTEEKLLDDLNQLAEAERQARLVNGAKKEALQASVWVTWHDHLDFVHHEGHEGFGYL